MPEYLRSEQEYHQRASTPRLAALTKGLEGIIDLLEGIVTEPPQTRAWTTATSFAGLRAIMSGAFSPRHVPLHPQQPLCLINVRVITVVIGFWPLTAVWQEGRNLSSRQDNVTMLCLWAWQFKKAVRLHPTIR
jgi:hypothetical protein